MTPLTVTIAAAIIGLLVGSALVPGAPIFGIPIVLVLVAILGATEVRRRQVENQSIQEHRDRPEGGEAIEFTTRDRQTLVD